MKKLPNSKMILSVALAVIFANTIHFARAQEALPEQAADIAPPPPSVWEGEEASADFAPPPPSAQVLNKHTQPNVVVPRGFRPAPTYKANLNFARLSHKNSLDVCVNFVAQNCDGHFTRKLVRALSRGTRDLVDSTTLERALKGQGIQNCGHYTGANGGLEMEAFQKGNQLILFSIPSPTERDPRQAVCKHSVITMPEMIADMKVTENRAWLVGQQTRGLYYVGADFKVRKAGKSATTLIGVAPDGKQLTVTGPSGLFAADSVSTNDLVGTERAAISFEDPRAAAAATLIPTAR